MAMTGAYQFDSAMTAAKADANSFRAFSCMNIALLMDTILMVSIFVVYGVVAVLPLLAVVLLSILITRTTEYRRVRQMPA